MFNTLKLKLKSIEIEYVESFNFLGLIISNHLSWSNYINKVASIISKTLGIINKVKHSLTQYTLLYVYKSQRQSQNSFICTDPK